MADQSSIESLTPETKLNASWLASLPPTSRQKFLESLTDEEHAALLYNWQFWARANQLPPAGDWTTWAIIAGRGFGKTRTGAETVRAAVESGEAGRLAIVAQDAGDARDVMIEGESGLLAISPPWNKPNYEPSKRRVTWANGATATLFSAEDPDALRGPQFDFAWCDELAKWRYAQAAWDNLQFGLRLGTRPKQVVTTTPRPISLLRQILKDETTVTTRGSTYENRANLAPAFFRSIISRYEGTRLGRQELQAELLDEVPGALWTRQGLDENRVRPEDVPDLQRVVVGVDPATAIVEGTNLEEYGTAETGIVAAGLGVDGRAYILGDYSCRLNPGGWGRRAISAIDLHNGDAVVAETNQGGAMVVSTIKAARATQKVIPVHASRGKITRAEPIAALYEQGRVVHVGTFPELEDQMMLFTAFGIEGSTGDRVDALVWALTALFPQILRSTKDRRRDVQQVGVGNYDPHRN